MGTAPWCLIGPASGARRFDERGGLASHLDLWRALPARRRRAGGRAGDPDRPAAFCAGDRPRRGGGRAGAAAAAAPLAGRGGARLCPGCAAGAGHPAGRARPATGAPGAGGGQPRVLAGHRGDPGRLRVAPGGQVRGAGLAGGRPDRRAHRRVLPGPGQAAYPTVHCGQCGGGIGGGCRGDRLSGGYDLLWRRRRRVPAGVLPGRGGLRCLCGAADPDLPCGRRADHPTGLHRRGDADRVDAPGTGPARADHRAHLRYRDPSRTGGLPAYPGPDRRTGGRVHTRAGPAAGHHARVPATAGRRARRGRLTLVISRCIVLASRHAVVERYRAAAAPPGGRELRVMTAVFSHGRLRLYLLKLLAEGPKHGYELIRLLENRFLGLYTPSAGTIYPRLQRLEAEGLVSHAAAGGRKVYQITEAGRAELSHRAGELAELEREIHASVADLTSLATEIEQQVSGSVRDIRRELREAARESRTANRPSWGGRSAWTWPGTGIKRLIIQLGAEARRIAYRRGASEDEVRAAATALTRALAELRRLSSG